MEESNIGTVRDAADQKSAPRFELRIWDRFHTRETANGIPLDFIVQEIHSDDYCAGSLVEAGDEGCTTVRWIEDISSTDMVALGWMPADDPH